MKEYIFIIRKSVIQFAYSVASFHFPWYKRLAVFPYTDRPNRQIIGLISSVNSSSEFILNFKIAAYHFLKNSGSVRI